MYSEPNQDYNLKFSDCWETRIRHHRNHDEEHLEPVRTELLTSSGTTNSKELVDEVVDKDGPVFRSRNNSVMYAHAGSTTSLSCQIFKDVQHGVITWGLLAQEGQPYTLLTVGDSSYIDNLRFSIEKPIRHDQWNLLIKPVEIEDSGTYECQATTHPPQSIMVKLIVLEAYAEIIGTKEKVFKSESNLQLVCALQKATAKPDFIFWYHNNRMINYDTDRGISVVEDSNGSTLTISSVSVSQSGNYTCKPSNMKPDSVVVTILAESKSANALQDNKVSGVLRSSMHSFLCFLPAVLFIVSSF
ncbi:vascular endothelial growth factor receptor 1 isoform X2 [Eurytemora carolleeae]|uniref:vascular endothelial growth factor receptor 1 isoform X2 n=1 Tax=Eurytemora carolleeae TaxID=1294199 RepID=UPI000C76AEF7|nr:vascular endothelial growth factor receptor 1 isoform X2 [Eurytemora carolleeae]|eukprot:XP_023337905.1 vascular endothelial growth factor receptor 1-like isoform X2 [Eurytemora affinis]